MKSFVSVLVTSLIIFFITIAGFTVYAQSLEQGPNGVLPLYTQFFSRIIFGDNNHNAEEIKNIPLGENNNVFPLNGNVGIGTLERPEKLTVNGNILAFNDVCTSAGKCLNSVCNGSVLYEDGLIFYAHFDEDLHATYAAGNKFAQSSVNAVKQIIQGTDFGVMVPRVAFNHHSFSAMSNMNPNRGTIELWVKGGDLKDGNQKFLFDIQKDNQANIYGTSSTTLNSTQRFLIKNSTSSGISRLDFWILENSSKFLKAQLINLSSLNNDTWYKIRASWDTALSYAVLEIVGSGLSNANTLLNKPVMGWSETTNLYIGSQVGGAVYATDGSNTQYDKVIREIKIFDTVK